MSINELPPEPERRRGLYSSLLQKLNLRFPGLFLFLGVVLIVDLLVPDFIPFIDEIVLAILTAIFGLWREKKQDSRPEPEVPARPLPPAGPALPR